MRTQRLNGAFLKLRREVGIPLHHHERLMPGQLHDLVKRHAPLHQTRCKCVPQIVEANICQPGDFPRPLEGAGHGGNGLALKNEHRAALMRPEVIKDRPCASDATVAQPSTGIGHSYEISMSERRHHPQKAKRETNEPQVSVPFTRKCQAF